MATPTTHDNASQANTIVDNPRAVQQEGQPTQTRFLEKNDDERDSSSMAENDELVIDGEPLEPRCQPNFEGAVNITLSREYYFVRGDNTIHRIQLDQALGSDYKPEVWQLDNSYQFYFIATSTQNDIVVTWTNAGEVFLVEYNARLLSKITDEVFPEVNGLSLSPDGEWVGISFAPDYPLERRFQLHLINLRTGSQVTLSDPTKNYSAPVWSPTGDKFAFGVYDDRTSQIQMMDIHTRKITSLSAGGECHSDPTWSPDGTQLLFSTANIAQNTEIYLVDAGSDDLTRLWKSSTPKNITIEGWSPSGAYILFGSFKMTGELDLCLISVDSNEEVCPWLTAGNWTFPVWLFTDEQVALLKMNISDPYDFGTLVFDSVEMIDVPLSVFDD